MKSTRACRWSTCLALPALLLGASCAAEIPYFYRPAVPSLTDTEGHATAVYPIPPERPEGEVRLYSFGVVELETTPGAGKFPALHARLVVANNGDGTPWTLDTREVFLDIPNEGSAAAIYANTDVGAMPTVNIARGERRLVDFYFPVPGPVRSARQVPSFDLRWTVETGARPIAQRTPFQRFEAERPEPHTEVAIVTGWPFWWVHPLHHHHRAFVHRPVVIIPAPPHRVIVRPHAWARPRHR